MAILWCGGEDVDFPVGPGAPLNISTTSLYFNAGYARCTVNNNAVLFTGTTRCQSNPFPGGALTSAWLSFRLRINLAAANQTRIGFGQSGTSKGLYLGTDASNSTQFALIKYDGTTRTQLAAETSGSADGTTLGAAPIYRIDMQVINYGATATVNVWIDGRLAITYIGDVMLSGMSNFDCVTIPGQNGISGGGWQISEVIVADEDTRGMRLVTMAPTAAGTTDQWNAYTDANPANDVNPVAFVSFGVSDANAVYSNISGQNEQFNVSDLPTIQAPATVRAVKAVARAATLGNAQTTKLALGVNSGGSVNAGTLQTTTTSYTSYERLMTQNPVTSADWLLADMNALQINLQSGT